MERDCVQRGTIITGNIGLSFKIEDFESKNITVLGWNQDKNGMKPALQTQFLYKGERECVDIYLEDGRKLSFTPEHRFLTSDNQWIKANELKIGESKLKCSVKYPCIVVKDEITECNNWSLKVSDNLILKTNSL